MSVKIIRGDALEVLRTLPDENVHCCVTSPPYWGLRDYGVPPSIWGGDPACVHEWGTAGKRHRGGPTGDSAARAGRDTSAQDATCDLVTGSFCACGAWRGCLGLEPTPALYVEHMVAVFREVRRVLRDDGTLWLNLGDSYATGGGAVGRAPGGGDQGERFIRAGMINTQPNRMPIAGLKPKDLVGIPWRVAFALQADGWYLRQDIIWEKPNPMPESVRDRCTKSHEYIFLLAKSERYHFDQDAILEPVSAGTHARLSQDVQNQFGSKRVPRKTNGPMKAVARKLAPTGSGIKNNKSFDAAMAIMPSERNKRSVWTVATQPFKETHFATFPPALIEPCILAGCPVDGVVLDPFGGSGTTGLVADRLQRDVVLIELNQEYAAMAERRIRGDAPLFADVT